MATGGEAPMSVPPDQGHKADMDPMAYQKSGFTAGDETGGLWKFVFQFVLAFAAAFAAAKSFGLNPPQLFGVIAGVVVPVAFYLFKRNRLKENTQVMVKMQRALHELEQEAKRLEIEDARRNGDLDRWSKEP